MNADSQDNKIRSRFFGPQNAQFDTSPFKPVAHCYIIRKYLIRHSQMYIQTLIM